MSSTYTGVGSNVTPSTSPTETIPADGDALTAASSNVTTQKLLDYVANIFGILTGGGQSSTGVTAPGASLTGAASAPGVKATAGGGGAPVRGALALVGQVTPSAPTDG